MRTACTLLCVTLLCAGYPIEARAQAKTSVAAQVGQLFDQAQAAFAKGDKQGAYEAYKTAWALQKSYDIAGNLGNVEARLGKFRDAAEHLTYALENYPPTGDPATQKAMEKKLAEVLTRVGRLRVRVTANGAKVDGAKVTVNGNPAGTASIAGTLFVEPGPTAVEAKLAGYLDGRQQVVIAKGGEQSVALDLVPLPPPRRSIVPGAVLGSVAGVALVTGIGLFLGGRSKASSARDLRDAILKGGVGCVSGAAHQDPRCDELHSTASTGNTLQKAGVGLMIGAGAAAVGTVIYFVLPPARSGAASSGLRVTPTLLPTNAGLVFSGTF